MAKRLASVALAAAMACGCASGAQAYKLSVEADDADLVGGRKSAYINIEDGVVKLSSYFNIDDYYNNRITIGQFQSEGIGRVTTAQYRVFTYGDVIDRYSYFEFTIPNTHIFGNETVTDFDGNLISNYEVNSNNFITKSFIRIDDMSYGSSGNSEIDVAVGIGSIYPDIFSGEGSNNFVSYLDVTAVPLPASAPLFGTALLGLAAAGYAAKRRQAAA